MRTRKSTAEHTPLGRSERIPIQLCVSVPLATTKVLWANAEERCQECFGEANAVVCVR
jgi:hypothetical protein